MLEADVAIVGAGAAGLSLAHRLACPAPGTRRLSVLLVDAPPGPCGRPDVRGASGSVAAEDTTRP